MKRTAQPIQKKDSGFTLIELLVVIGILAVLLAIVLIAINPARQFAQANNTQRRSDVTAILNAIDQYAADNGGTMPPGIPTVAPAADISSAVVTVGVPFTAAAFCNSIVPVYIAALPRDPSTPTTAHWTSCDDHLAGYQVIASVSGATNTPRVTVSAPGAQLNVSIAVTR